MANRLQKVPAVQYIPGQPGTPATPAYCVDSPVFSDFGAYAAALQLNQSLANAPAMKSLEFYSLSGVDADGNPSYSQQFVSVPPDLTSIFTGAGATAGAVVWKVDRICFPPVPGTPATPPSVAYDALPGWNSGGSSIGGFQADGYAEFQIGPAAIGAIVGLNTRSDTISPADCSHAFYGHQGMLDVFEDGAIVFSVPGGLAGAPRLRVARSGGQVQYLVNNTVVYTSTKASSGHARLDASLYIAGDYVESPMLGIYAFGAAAVDVGVTAYIDPRARAAGAVSVSGWAQGRAGDRFYGAAVGYIGADGVAAGFNTNAAMVTVSIGGNGSARAAANRADATLPALTGIASEGPYAQATLVYRGGYRGEAVGGFPEVSIAYAVGYGPRAVGFSSGPSGGVGAAAGQIAPALGVSGETGYAQAGLVYRGAYFGIAYAPWLADEAAQFGEPVLLRDSFSLGADLQASFISTIEVGDEVLLEIEITEGLEWFETIFAGSQMAEEGDVDLAFADQVLVSTQTNIPQLEGIQYASNVLTGAITRYSNFDFLAITRTPYGAFGVREDGIYRIAPGDDDGDTVDMEVDFGATDYGTNQLKRVDSVYFGLCTDGQVLAVLKGDDGVEYSYKVIAREPTMRATTAKGVTGRSWRLKLKIYAATQAELATVETSVAASSRRLT